MRDSRNRHARDNQHSSQSDNQSRRPHDSHRQGEDPDSREVADRIRELDQAGGAHFLLAEEIAEEERSSQPSRKKLEGRPLSQS